MKKNRLQQQTLNHFFKPLTTRYSPLQSDSSSGPHAVSAEVINVDEEAMSEMVCRAPLPPQASQGAAPSTAAGAAPRDEAWLLGQTQVIFPWSPLNTRVGANGEARQVWDSIQHILREPLRATCSEDLRSLLVKLDQLMNGPGNTFEPLRRAVGKMSAAEQTYLFDHVLPWMKERVLHGPALFENRTIPLLVQGKTQRVVLSHDEIVSLMCCCFFSLFPQRSEAGKRGGCGRGQKGSRAYTRAVGTTPAKASDAGAAATHGGVGGPLTTWVSRKLPCCNYSSLFSCGAVGRDACLDSKIRGFIEYFFCCHRHDADPLSPAHNRCLELTRASYVDFPKFEESTQPLSAVSMHRTGLIENDAESLQVDFANRFVGGGVLRSGCVQEEIRMTLAPEMVLSRLLCEELAEAEVLFISGAPNFCEATGYAESFRFKNGCDPWASQVEGDSRCSSLSYVPQLRPAQATHPQTQKPMLIHDVCVLAMDAHNFRKHGRQAEQYRWPFLQRELRKAYVGFHGVPESFAVLPTARTGSIASGHWGCGAYCGDKELKLLLQWCAAAEAGGRPLHYYTFDTPLNDFDELRDKILSAGWTVGKLVQTLIQYHEYRSKVPENEAMRPFQFVEQVCTVVQQPSSY